MNELIKQQTILIVDDAKENINVLAELLRPDFKIRAATSGGRHWISLFRTIRPS